MRSFRGIGLVLINLLWLLKFANAQTTVVDSLESLLPKYQDSAKVDVLNELTYQYITIDPSQARLYGWQAIALGNNIDYPKGLAQSYNDLGMVYYYTSRLDSAVFLFEESLTIRRQLGDAIGIAASLNKIGAIYKLRGLLAEAINYFSQTVAYYDSLGMQAELAASYNNMGTLYYDLNDYPQALEYFQLSLRIKNLLGNTVEVAGTISNVANVQFYLGRYAESKANYEEAIALLEAQNEKQYQPNCYIGLANIEEKEGQMIQALRYYEKALALSDYALNANVFQASTRYRMGYVYSQLGRYEEAEQYLVKAEKIATTNGLNQMLIDIYEVMIQFYAQQGRSEEAMPIVEKALMLKDTLFSQTRNELIAEMQTRFEVAEQEKANQLLLAENEIQRLKLEKTHERTRNQQLIYGGLFLSLLLLGGIGYNRLKVQQQRKTAEQEKAQFRAVVEAEDQARKRIAMELHDGLGQLLSTAKLNVQGLDEVAVQGDDFVQTNYHNTLQLIDQACDEVRHVSHNMMPGALTRIGLQSAMTELVQRINSAGQLQVTVNGELPNNLPENVSIGLYRVLQELFNNLIKHAQATQATLVYSQNGPLLEVRLHDNGKGLSKQAVEKSRGMGWKNIHSRISILNGQLKWHSEPGKGTQFVIQLPINNTTP